MTAARVVIHLDDYRHTAPIPAPQTQVGAVAEGSSRRPGLAYRVTHSPAARDLRDNAIPMGLLLSFVLVLIWSVTR